MKILIKLGLIVLGASALTLTMASATGDSGKAEKQEMKCQAGKCGGAEKKDMKCNGGKDMKKDTGEKGEAKGKCGQGKCGK